MIGKHLIELLLVSLVIGSVSAGVPPGDARRDLGRRLPQIADAHLPRQIASETVRLLPVAADRVAGPVLGDGASLGVKVTAASALVVDRDTGNVLFEKNADEVRPIASITKLMTALVFLETHPDPDRIIVIEEADQTPADGAIFRVGDRVTVRDLLFATLVGSANDAARALARASYLEKDEFVQRMNLFARDLGLEHTRFVEPTGLDPRNVSTARELAELVRAASAQSQIGEAARVPVYHIPGSTKRAAEIRSTNMLLGSFLNVDPYRIAVAKTGSLDEAGFCMAISVEHGAHGVITVVLGSTNHFSRFEDIKALVYWTFTKWQWPDVIPAQAAVQSPIAVEDVSGSPDQVGG
ncbi:D-alanyl-D-alanine carboxypeptidase [Candidatus Uhrbacteria bacterium]|nr:D-alanyl-D-alanine carboxypeptidase [Candidatus Uhrbacteria bacterium]